MSDSISDNYSLMDYFNCCNLINAFETQPAIVMIKTIWEKELGVYKIFENEISKPNIPDYKIYSFQDNESDCVYSFRAGWGCDRDQISESMLYAVSEEFNAANSSTSLFLTLFDIYNSAVQNTCTNFYKVEVNIACNTQNGDFADEIMGLTINDDILEMDSFDYLPCKFDDNKLIFDVDIEEENYHLEIPAKLKDTCVGNVFWNVYEISLSETTRLINFLLNAGWSVSSAESSLYEAISEGEISEQDLELAFEN